MPRAKESKSSVNYGLKNDNDVRPCFSLLGAEVW